MEKRMARAPKTKKTYKAAIYTSRFYAELNRFALAGKTSPAFPQYSNRGRSRTYPLQPQNVGPNLRQPLLLRPDVQLHGGQLINEGHGVPVLT